MREDSALAVLRLVTIPISHFCEKARWALERAGIAYREERHVQGVHRLASRRAGGKGTVPVLVTPEGALGESGEILEWVDARLPAERRLLPDDPAARREVQALCAWLDAGLGPDGRLVMYSHMLRHRALMLRVNCQGVPLWEARLLRTGWPLVVGWGKRYLGLTATAVETAERRTREAFDEVARRLDGRPHLWGDRFGAADLTFAALAAALVVPPEYGVRLPQPHELPAETAAVVESFRAHPAGRFALETFARERRADAAHRRAGDTS